MVESQTTRWPPPYILRRSRRAKSLRISFDRHHQLQVVYPYFVTKRVAKEFLNEQRPWVEKQLAKIQSNAKSNALPLRVHLLAINKSWYVHYIKKNGHSVRVSDGENSLTVTGCVDDHDLCRLALKRWIARKASECLTPMLDQQVIKTGINYQQVRYRAQHTLWGSCSKQGDLSLNIKLLFLPVEWVEYVMVHELCHRKYFNHSKDFWDLVARFELNYKHIKNDMHNAQQYIPGWFV